MTATLEDVDLHSLLSDLSNCEHIHETGERCHNRAEWVCRAVPCGCPRLFCTGCKAIVQALMAKARRQFQQGHYRCTQCDERVYKVDWEAL